MSYDSDFTIIVTGLNEGFSCAHKDYPKDSIFCPYCGVKIGSMDSIIEALKEMSRYSFYESTKGKLILTSSSWYDWEMHMRQLSEKFDCLFSVIREGEDSLHIEKCYFYKGKSFNPGKVIITFEKDTDEERKKVLGV